jgi:hypothetical protein
MAGGGGGDPQFVAVLPGRRTQCLDEGERLGQQWFGDINGVTVLGELCRSCRGWRWLGLAGEPRSAGTNPEQAEQTTARTAAAAASVPFVMVIAPSLPAGEAGRRDARLPHSRVPETGTGRQG